MDSYVDGDDRRREVQYLETARLEPCLKTEISATDYENGSQSGCETVSSDRLKTSDKIRWKHLPPKPSISPTSETEDHLYAAAEKGDLAGIKALLGTAGNDLGSKDLSANGLFGHSRKLKTKSHFKSPLIAACSNGQRAVVEELIKSGYDVSVANESGRTGLHQACQGGHVQVVELLVEFTDHLDTYDRDGLTPAHLAALNGEVKCLQVLYDRGADMESVDAEGRRLAHLAATRNHHPVLEFLHEYGIDLQCTDNRGRLPLHLAAKHGALGCLVCLAERDCDTTLPDNNRNLAIHYAASNNHLDSIRFLVAQGTSMDVVQSQGKTPVFLAAENGATTVLHWLLEKGSKSDTKDVCGNSALHAAAAAGHGPAYNCLLTHDADAASVNKKGETPFEVAKKHGHPLLIKDAAIGKVRCPHCVGKEKHDLWHLAHPVPRVTRDITALGNKLYACPTSLLRTSSKDTSAQRTETPDFHHWTRSGKTQTKGTKTAKGNMLQQMPARSLAARYFGEHLSDL